MIRLFIIFIFPCMLFAIDTYFDGVNAGMMGYFRVGETGNIGN